MLERMVLGGSTAEAHIYPQGAHVTHYARRGERPLLFLSARSLFEPGKAIRGGVPVIFPWFGARSGHTGSPSHGFARTALWQVESPPREEGGVATTTLRLDADAATRALWPHDFTCRYRIRAGEGLELVLEVTNPSAEAWTFEAALHTYLAVGDAATATLTGLDGATFIDKMEGLARRTLASGPWRLTGETDRVFVATRATVVVDDPAWRRRLVVDKQGSATTIVWNPWAAGAVRLSDLADDEWQAMLCVETANAADDAVTLAPGGRHEMRVTLRAEAAATARVR